MCSSYQESNPSSSPLLVAIPRVTHAHIYEEIKRSGREADQSIPNIVQVIFLWRYTFTLPYVFMIIA
jgi:hypothetical protein